MNILVVDNEEGQRVMVKNILFAAGMGCVPGGER